MVRDDMKKHVTIAVILVFTVSVILVLTGGAINLSIKGIQEREAQKYMKEIVSQYNHIITAQIDGDMQILDAVAVLAGQGGADELNDVLPYLEDYMEEMNGRNDFIRIGMVSAECLGCFADADGTRHYEVDVSDEEFIGQPPVSGWGHQWCPAGVKQRQWQHG